MSIELPADESELQFLRTRSAAEEINALANSEAYWQGLPGIIVGGFLYALFFCVWACVANLSLVPLLFTPFIVPIVTLWVSVFGGIAYLGLGKLAEQIGIGKTFPVHATVVAFCTAGLAGFAAAFPIFILAIIVDNPNPVPILYWIVPLLFLVQVSTFIAAHRAIGIFRLRPGAEFETDVSVKQESFRFSLWHLMMLPVLIGAVSFCCVHVTWFRNTVTLYAISQAIAVVPALVIAGFLIFTSAMDRRIKRQHQSQGG